MKRVLVILTALPLMAFSSMAFALTCDEVDLSYEVTSRFPTAQEACLEVLERDGQQFMKMRVELARDPRGNNATFRFIHADGTHGPTYSAELDPSWRANIQGRDYRLRELSRGQELSVYLPSDRWAVHVAAWDVVVQTITPVAIVDAEPEQLMLPETASNMPLFALFGGLALFGAAAIRVSRRRSI